MNDDELKLLAERGSVYRPLSPRPRRRAIWLLAVALAGLAALWFLWPGEAAPGLPPLDTRSTWPPQAPSTYFCNRGDPRPPSYCFTNSRRPYRSSGSRR